MKSLWLPLLLISLFFMASQARAQLLGPSTDSIKTGVSDGIFDSLAKHAGDWIANGMDSIGNWALKTLFNIYDKYIGTFLIRIPDLASPKTYKALVNDPNGVITANNSALTVFNILKITTGTGLFILILGFVIDTGQRSSGLWDRFIDASVLIGFVAAFLTLFAWSTIHSYMTNAVSAMGYFIYNQNTLQTTGVLQGFQNINLDTEPGYNAARLSQYDFRTNFISSQGILWNLSFLISIALVIVGFYNCYSAASAGDSKSGNQRFFQAVAGLVLILGVPTLVHVLVLRGADAIGNQPVIAGESLSPFSMQGLIGENGVQYPSQNGQAVSSGTALSGDALAGVAAVSQTPQESRWAKFAGGLIKCGVSLWGLIVVFAVIFAKFFQVLNIWVMFVLGPIFIGFLGHPATAPIFWGAARYFIKLLLYSVIWAITLVGLYLIPNIDWGVETIGVNSLLTSIAILAGLQMIANVQEFASLFTTFSGANLKGEGYKDAVKGTQGAASAANSARLGVFGLGKTMTGETAQAMGSATGAVIGSVIPGVGTATGALAGKRTMQGFNAAAKVGGIGGKKNYQGGSGNPISNALKRFSGNVIGKNLSKDWQNDSRPSYDEAKKRKLIGDYASRLLKSGRDTSNRKGKGRNGYAT